MRCAALHGAGRVAPWLSHRQGVAHGGRARRIRRRLTPVRPITDRVGEKSSADDLALGRGVVLSRAATTLRSIETLP